MRFAKWYSCDSKSRLPQRVTISRRQLNQRRSTKSKRYVVLRSLRIDALHCNVHTIDESDDQRPSTATSKTPSIMCNRDALRLLLKDTADCCARLQDFAAADIYYDKCVAQLRGVAAPSVMALTLSFMFCYLYLLGICT